jgi:tRNA(Ile)-lysidine synthase
VKTDTENKPGASPLPQIRDAANSLGIETATVLVAVSGGCDSVALLRGLHELRTSLDLKFVVAHFNHGWRAEESDADAVWVEALAEQLNLPCVSESRDSKRDPLANSTSTTATPSAGSASEESARRDRYEFLARAAFENGCQFIAVGHTADDQTETVLHHILRGTGLAGLRGIAATRQLDNEVTLVRPILECRRTELEAWMRSISQDWRTDRTNASLDFTRNRIRHELLPLLEEQFNPQVRRVLATLSCQAEEAGDLVRTLAEKALPEVILTSSADDSTVDSIRLDGGVLRRLPAIVRRETLVLAWKQQGWPLQGMSFFHWQNLAAIAESGGAMTLPGNVDARLRGGLLVLRKTTNGE